ncbi:LysE family translocator [Brevibacterium casei]|uniref:Leucine efflux protein n=1 Tax=Brevibacterium casei TaxID=33889 RepID=A0A269ZDY5_9MICO|nr:LysE family translocator [Brevibacterium casei]MCT1550070.1 LysE family translocator [Brevibacterium casei]MCT1559247.1 LysE family translocator [Brevibacterium casei]MCT2208016.1 LysE family translocator [Brevibacterium casei]PAK95720.1 lysine transporter LysE [Brevibacterium casei]VEW14424.1 Leucine efflux protein [Brevibacterium casei]
MLTWAQMALFIPAAAAVAASPGANNLLAFRNGLRSGFRPAALALTGRFLAFTIMLGLVVAGLGVVLQSSQLLFETLRIVGATFLVCLGVWILWSTRRRRSHDDETVCGEVEDHQDDASHSVRLAMQEFVTAAANPKALLLFTAFLPPFVNTASNAAPGSAQLALLGALYIACEAVTALIWAASGRLLAMRGIKQRTLRRLDQASGGAFIALGGGLAASDYFRR